MNRKILAKINRESSSVIFIDGAGTIVGTDEKLWDRFPYLTVVKMYKKLKSGEKSVAEFEDGGRILKLTGKPFDDGIYLIEIEDITTQRCIEDFKKKIVSTVSHELKTPLTIIKGYSELLAMEMESEILEKMNVQIERIINIVESIGLLMRGQGKELVEIDVETVIEELSSQFLDRITSKGLKFNREIESGLTVKAEKILFRQMLINLIDNAVKFTESGEIGVKAWRDKDTVVIEVYDTGKGIPESIKPFIFEKFVKSDESPGLGIGLSLVKTIAKHHNWEVTFQSASEKGTRFFVKIPVNS